MGRFRQETFAEKAYRYRAVAMVISVPTALIFFVLIAMPRTLDDPSSNALDRSPQLDLSGRNSALKMKYAVVFDAGSSGSRVHVYCFDSNMELVPIGNDMELFKQKKPGLSSFASNPAEGANSLKSLLDEAINVVPADQRAETPVRLGATAGLRALPGDSAKNLLQEVTDFLADSPFNFVSNWVSILDGIQEGAFEWVTINYLLGNIGKDYSQTVGVVDLGGGSVQMAYAISEEDAKNAPKPVNGEDAYVEELNLLGRKYYLYVHSYLHFGLLAARAEVLKLLPESETSPCLARGFEGEYPYGSSKYRAVGSKSGADFKGCQHLILAALNKDHACEHMHCTFGGVWSGGGGDGLNKLFVASFFFDRAFQAGIIKDPNAVEAKLKAADFQAVAQEICALNVIDIENRYPLIDENDRPYFCLDLIYQYTLLVDGFGVDRNQEITLIKKVKYNGSSVEAAWPLGSAIEVISASK